MKQDAGQEEHASTNMTGTVCQTKVSDAGCVQAKDTARVSAPQQNMKNSRRVRLGGSAPQESKGTAQEGNKGKAKGKDRKGGKGKMNPASTPKQEGKGGSENKSSEATEQEENQPSIKAAGTSNPGKEDVTKGTRSQEELVSEVTSLLRSLRVDREEPRIENGYVVKWDRESCRIEHVRQGKIPIEMNQGCPTVQEVWGKRLMEEVEETERRKARIRAIMACGVMAEDEHEKKVAELQALFPQVPMRILERTPGRSNGTRINCPSTEGKEGRYKEQRQWSSTCAQDPTRSDGVTWKKKEWWCSTWTCCWG